MKTNDRPTQAETRAKHGPLAPRYQSTIPHVNQGPQGGAMKLADRTQQLFANSRNKPVFKRGFGTST
jgi:hypothetical protein